MLAGGFEATRVPELSQTIPDGDSTYSVCWASTAIAFAAYGRLIFSTRAWPFDSRYASTKLLPDDEVLEIYTSFWSFWERREKSDALRRHPGRAAKAYRLDVSSLARIGTVEYEADIQSV
jgi:hypothetical protein